jgi:hypothetical protein
MCASLRVDDGWVVRWLQKSANDVRHGGAVSVTDEKRQRSLLATREVIQRYMFWRTSGGSGAVLSAAEHPRLRAQDDPLPVEGLTNQPKSLDPHDPGIVLLLWAPERPILYLPNVMAS